MNIIPFKPLHGPENWDIHGKYFGYPKCCIDWFVTVNKTHARSVSILNRYPRASRLIGHSGFIPCEKHLKLIESGKVKYTSLICNRQHVQPFPFDSLS